MTGSSVRARQLTRLAVLLLLGVAGCAPAGGTTGPAKPTRSESPPPPCHPGCFPAGTTIATPDGPRPIESVRDGDLVTLVDADGAATVGRVEASFRTCNRLVEVRTETGSLVTTATQPLCLRRGEFCRAGELTAGDLIWRWDGDERRPVRVLAVVPTERDEAVFNLVVGESAVFVAGGFLARGKPPALATSGAAE